jgi:exosortase
MPFALAYLVHRILARDRDTSPESSAWGLLLVGLGVLMATADVAARTLYLSAFGFLVTLPGLALVLLGPRRTRALAAPLALAWLMLPVPATSAVHLYLRRATAWAVEPLLHAVGVPAYRQSTIIEIPRQVFVVANDCSGFSTLYAALAVAVVLAVLCRSHRRRVMLLVAAPLLALAANVLRVLGLILLTGRFGVWILETAIHPLSGVLTFAIALGGLFWIAGPDLRDRGASSP